jgi:hypothetical protein
VGFGNDFPKRQLVLPYGMANGRRAFAKSAYPPYRTATAPTLRAGTRPAGIRLRRIPALQDGNGKRLAGWEPALPGRATAGGPIRLRFPRLRSPRLRSGQAG